MNINLDAALKRIATHGPDRVLIGDTGLATRPRQAVERGVNWEIVFIRDDGWTLAATDEDAGYAYDIWKGYWTHFAEFHDGRLSEARPIAEYVRQ